MKSLLILMLLVALTATASAQYQISGWSMDGGGGHSAGGVHSLRGSVGQPSGGVAKSSAFTLAGGYFGFVAVVANAEAPTLRMVPGSREVILAWPSGTRGFQLQETASLTKADWNDVAQSAQLVGNEYQVRLPWQTGDRFFRLRKP